MRLGVPQPCLTWEERRGFDARGHRDNSLRIGRDVLEFVTEHIDWMALLHTYNA